MDGDGSGAPATVAVHRSEPEGSQRSQLYRRTSGVSSQ